jgi:PDZ domain
MNKPTTQPWSIGRKPLVLLAGMLLTASASVTGAAAAEALNKQSYLGVEVGNPPQGSRKGAVMTLVWPGAPAAAAGLCTKDIVVELDGKAVENKESFAAIIAQLPPDKKINIKFIRGGQTSTITATLGELTPALTSFARGSERASVEDRDGALSNYVEAIRLDPKLGLAYIGRGLVMANLNQDAAALADYAEAARLEPKLEAAAYIGRGRIHAKTSLAAAIADYTEAIRLDPKLSLAYCYRGLARTEKADWKRAMTDYAEAIRIDPTCALAYFGRGVAKAGKSDRKGAMADYAEAIQLTPNDTRFYEYRARTREQMGDKAGAAQDRAAAAKINEETRLAEEQQKGAEFHERISKASLTDLLVASDASESQARERNRRIITAKNTQLPALLRDSKAKDLSALVVKIEQTILDLNHEGEVAKDQAQQMAVANSATPQIENLRGLAISYQERIELLKPIASALKEEIANRNR